MKIFFKSQLIQRNISHLDHRTSHLLLYFSLPFFPLSLFPYSTPLVLTQLYRARRTVLQMLFHREYVVLRTDLDMTFDDFKNRFGQNEDTIRDELTLLVAHKEKPEQKMIVFFGKPTRLVIDDISAFSNRMELDGITNAIVVVDKNPTPRFNEGVNALNANGAQSFEIFNLMELLVNITEHVLVPKHVPLKPEQTLELLRKYKLKPSQLPRIQHSDPIARYYGLKKGNVVKIIRKSETAGKYVTYRVVA